MTDEDKGALAAPEEATGATFRLAQNIVTMQDGKRVVLAYGQVVSRKKYASLLEADPRIDLDHADHARQALLDEEKRIRRAAAAGKVATETARVVEAVGKPRGRARR